MKKLLYLPLLLSFQTMLAQNPAPAHIQSKPIMITGANVHIGTGNVMENAVLIFEKGKITNVSENFNGDRSAYEIIDAKGKHVYPGFIACNTILGLSEIEAARATNDYAEVGGINPNARALIAYNTDSKVIPTVRSNGILLAQIVPQGGLLSGISSVMMLDGWNWEDAAYKTDQGIHVNWPSMSINPNPAAPPADEQREKSENQIQSLRAFLKEAKAYNSSMDIPEKNLRFESAKGLFDGSKKLFVNADYVKEIIAAVDLARELALKLVIVGGADSWMVADLLKENNVAVIVNKTHSLPSREESDVDLPYKLPYLLEKAGVLYAISIEGFWQERNLPFNAGTAAAYGLSKEQALAAITINPAKILSIDNVTGTLEVGKDANIIISSGDALDMRTNNIEAAFIQGRQIDLNNHQKSLYQKYKNKYSIK
jgi:imidazolonepropionase-like amidohydrolase